MRSTPITSLRPWRTWKNRRCWSAATGERFVFADAPEVEHALRAAIAAEAGCCAFLRTDLARTADGLVLDVAGPEEARPIVAQLFA